MTLRTLCLLNPIDPCVDICLHLTSFICHVRVCSRCTVSDTYYLMETLQGHRDTPATGKNNVHYKTEYLPTVRRGDRLTHPVRL